MKTQRCSGPRCCEVLGAFASPPASRGLGCHQGWVVPLLMSPMSVRMMVPPLLMSKRSHGSVVGAAAHQMMRGDANQLASCLCSRTLIRCSAWTKHNTRRNVISGLISVLPQSRNRLSEQNRMALLATTIPAHRQRSTRLAELTRTKST